MQCCSPTGDPLFKTHFHFVATLFTTEKLKEFLKARAAACRAKIDALTTENTASLDREIKAIAEMLAKVETLPKSDEQKAEIRAMIGEEYAEAGIRETHAERLEEQCLPLRRAIEDFDVLADNLAQNAEFILEAPLLLALYAPEREQPALARLGRRDGLSSMLKSVRGRDLRKAAEALEDSARNMAESIGSGSLTRLSETKTASESSLG